MQPQACDVGFVALGHFDAPAAGMIDDRAHRRHLFRQNESQPAQRIDRFLDFGEARIDEFRDIVQFGQPGGLRREGEDGGRRLLLEEAAELRAEVSLSTYRIQMYIAEQLLGPSEVMSVDAWRSRGLYLRLKARG